MRLSARLVLGLFALVLAVPAAVLAAPLGDDAAASVPPDMAAQPKPHHHKGLFGRRHCVECQRAYAKAHDGVDIPPPPELGPIAGTPGHVHTAQAGNCLTCQGSVVVSGPVSSGDPHAPGYAVTTGPVTVAGAEAPGYAVVGETLSGPEPSPIGVSNSRQASLADPRMSAMGPRPGAGPVDPSVIPTGMPPAQETLTSPRHNRPHIISHLLGIPQFGQLRRTREDEDAKSTRQSRMTSPIDPSMSCRHQWCMEKTAIELTRRGKLDRSLGL